MQINRQTTVAEAVAELRNGIDAAVKYFAPLGDRMPNEFRWALAILADLADLADETEEPGELIDAVSRSDRFLGRPDAHGKVLGRIYRAHAELIAAQRRERALNTT